MAPNFRILRLLTCYILAWCLLPIYAVEVGVQARFSVERNFPHSSAPPWESSDCEQSFSHQSPNSWETDNKSCYHTASGVHGRYGPILCSDWLLEQARCARLARLPALIPCMEKIAWSGLAKFIVFAQLRQSSRKRKKNGNSQNKENIDNFREFIFLQKPENTKNLKTKWHESMHGSGFVSWKTWQEK